MPACCRGSALLSAGQPRREERSILLPLTKYLCIYIYICNGIKIPPKKCELLPKGNGSKCYFFFLNQSLHSFLIVSVMFAGRALRTQHRTQWQMKQLLMPPSFCSTWFFGVSFRRDPTRISSFLQLFSFTFLRQLWCVLGTVLDPGLLRAAPCCTLLIPRGTSPPPPPHCRSKRSMELQAHLTSQHSGLKFLPDGFEEKVLLFCQICSSYLGFLW